MIEKITVDFETRSRANLKKVAAWEYSLCPSTVVSCMGFKSDKPGHPLCYLFNFKTMQMPWAQLPLGFRKTWLGWIADPNVVFSAHNAFFEQSIYKNVLVKRLGWPAIGIRKWRCTAAKAAAVAIPRNLDGAGRVMQLRTQKDNLGHKTMLKLCKPTAAYKKWKDKYDKFILKDQHAQAEAMLPSEPPEFWTPLSAPEDYRIQDKYCKIDVFAEEELDHALPDLTPFEQELWFLDQRINQRGVRVDMPVIKKISAIMKAEMKSMNKELDALTMGLVSSGNARQQILDYLVLLDLELPDLKAKTVDEFLKNGKATGDAKKLLEIRRALSKASTAKYAAFERLAASDGRIRDLYLFCAASTHRWGGKGVQPQNLPRGIVADIDEAIKRIMTCDVEMLKLLYGQNLMPLFSSVLRGMFIATEGYEFFVEDYSAIECRVLWWIADHQEGLDFFRNGIDPYKEQAADIFEITYELVPDKDDPLQMRQTGKAAVLGCGFQMGPAKFVSAAYDVYRVRIDLDLAKVAVTSYRKKHWPVVDLWENLTQAAINAIENPGKVYHAGKTDFQVRDSFLWLKLPSGSYIAYKDPSIEMGKVITMKKEDCDTIYASNAHVYRKALEDGYVKAGEFPVKKIKYWAVNQKAKKEDCVIPKWTRETTYGGKLTENIVQKIARDLLAEAMVRVRKAGFEIVMHSHDELVSEAPIGKYSAQQYNELMEELPAWADGLPLKASGWTGTRYKKG